MDLTRMLKRALELCDPGLAEDEAVAIYFVDAKTIKEINLDYVGHEGITDVICFDYREGEKIAGENLSVEIFVCPDAAEIAAVDHKDRTYAGELALYAVHGMLHAAGEDDLEPLKKKRMRREEKKVIDKLKAEFDFSEIFKG
jgi:probable rRNA maturation factor